MMWTVILNDLEASDEAIADLRLLLLETCKTAGYVARSVTVQSFVYRENVKPAERFQEVVPSVFGGHRAKPRRGPGSRGPD